MGASTLELMSSVHSSACPAFELTPALGFESTYAGGFAILAPARCHAHVAESPAECDGLSQESSQQAIKVLRCHAHPDALQCFQGAPPPTTIGEPWLVTRL